MSDEWDSILGLFFIGNFGAILVRYAKHYFQNSWVNIAFVSTYRRQNIFYRR